MLSFRKLSRKPTYDDGPYLNTSIFSLRWSKRGLYNYHTPLNVNQFVMGDQVLQDLVSTSAFSRLRDVSFLGGIDYVLVRQQNQSKKRYNRYAHSLGVAKLASLYAQEVGLNYDERRLVCASALLHDIGHAPLSHSLESTFLKHFNIEHHKATEEIIRGQNAIGKDINEALHWHKIDAEKVIAVINGQDKSFDGFFDGPINFDTIEGILRSYSYATKRNPSVSPVAVTRSAIARQSELDRINIDEFWHYKNLVYTTIINSNYGILADKICQKHMEDNIHTFSREDYFTTERDLFRKLPKLKKLLTSSDFVKLASHEMPETVEFKKRKFFIDQDVNFCKNLDKQRYLQTKELSFLRLNFNTQDALIKQRNFFDDKPI